MSAAAAALAGCDLLLVAHGSRSEAGRAEMEGLLEQVARRCPGSRVALGYLELCDPPALDVVGRLVAAGARRIVVVPAMLYPAGHAKSDVPAVVLAGRAAHPRVRFDYARPLGADHGLLAAAARRIQGVGGGGLPLALLSRGSSDPDANADAYRVGRLVADMAGAPLVVSGFSGITWPSVPAALDQLGRLGAQRVTAFAWFLATGVLLERINEDCRRFSAATGVPVVDAGYLGAGPEVADVVVERALEAAAGAVAANCDACAYRRPFPGLEARVGQPAGVGHSHLAAGHLAAGHDHRSADDGGSLSS